MVAIKNLFTRCLTDRSSAKRRGGQVTCGDDSVIVCTARTMFCLCNVETTSARAVSLNDLLGRRRIQLLDVDLKALNGIGNKLTNVMFVKSAIVPDRGLQARESLVDMIQAASI